jgi:SAM-dependent methyltransferase
MPAHAPLDFGYPWWLDYGHLTIAIPALALFLIAYVRRWSRGALVIFGGITLWAGAAFLWMHYGFAINTSVPALPTEAFFKSGSGRVLDLGAGTGRSSIMVLAARPQATLVASDLFGDSFDQHFGHGEAPEQRLLRNLQAAGVEQRASIVRADMRKLPFDNQSFDALVSAYAVDHLNRDGIHQALSEAARVVKPGGDFLLILVANDKWAKLAFGPLLAHGGVRGREWWTARLQEAGFQVREDGVSPMTLYLLAKRP